MNKRPYSLKDIYREIYHMDLKITFRKKPYRLRVFREALVEGTIYFAKIIKDLLLYGGKMATDPGALRAKIWLIVSTKNNLDTLSFLREALENSVLTATNKKVQKIGACPRLDFHPAALYWFKTAYLFFALWPEFGSALLLRFDIFIKGVGLYEAGLRMLRRYGPRAIVFTNDHGPHQRALLWAAKRLDIPTVYIQHASVTADFPPLRYDLSLLEGMDSLEKYRAAGPVEGKVELIGMPKFDPYFSRKNTAEEIRNIGLCASVWDDADRMEKLLTCLSEHFPDIRLSFRPHPGDMRSFTLPKAVHFSDSRKEMIFDFLVRQELVVAGDTSLHLEAALLNINSLYFPMNELVSDVYGYVRNGLVEKMDDPEEIVEWIAGNRRRRPSVSPKVRYYNATAGTAQEGKSRELAIGHIRSLLEI